MRRKKGWMDLQVKEIIQETHDTRTLVFVNKEEQTRAFDYVAGQYLTFRFDGLAHRPVVRSYTMSSSPCQKPVIEVTVKEVDNGFISKYLCHDVKVGDTLRARGPIGRFCYDPEKDFKKAFMIAGGSGVTPFVSIIRQYASNSDVQLSLLVFYKTKKDLISWDTLVELNKLPNVNIHCSLTREDCTSDGFLYGRSNPQLFESLFIDPLDTTFFCCGPQLLMDQVGEYLASKNVAAPHYKTESFSS